MTTKTTKRKNAQRKPAVRRAFIPDDLSYMTDTEFGQQMLRLAREIAEEQGTRTTKEINQLIDLMRGGASGVRQDFARDDQVAIFLSPIFLLAKRSTGKWGTEK